MYTERITPILIPKVKEAPLKKECNLDDSSLRLSSETLAVCHPPSGKEGRDGVLSLQGGGGGLFISAPILLAGEQPPVTRCAPVQTSELIYSHIQQRRKGE